jgi:hypothetical protein
MRASLRSTRASHARAWRARTTRTALLRAIGLLLAISGVSLIWRALGAYNFKPIEMRSCFLRSVGVARS